MPACSDPASLSITSWLRRTLLVAVGRWSARGPRGEPCAEPPEIPVASASASAWRLQRRLCGRPPPGSVATVLPQPPPPSCARTLRRDRSSAPICPHPQSSSNLIAVPSPGSLPLGFRLLSWPTRVIHVITRGHNRQGENMNTSIAEENPS